MNPLDLKPHPINEKIYGKEPVDQELVKSIKKIGLLEMLVIKQDGTVISGHRRLKAVLEVGPEYVKKVPCNIVGFADEFEEKEALVSYNLQRKKTDMQLVAEIEILEQIYKHRAKIRQLTGLKQNNNSDDHSPTVVAKSATTEQDKKNRPGRTRDKVAEDLGISSRTVGMLKKLREASESDDTVIAQIADRLLKDQELSKNKKYNLFLNFMKIYHECNHKNPKISDYATGLVSDICGGFSKIEDAHMELANYIKAVENKEKAHINGVQGKVMERPNSKEINSILGAKPVDKPVKSKVSLKYQALLDAANAAKNENVFISDFARHQIKCVDNDELTIDDAYENVKSFIREQRAKEQARKEMLKMPAEPGELLEKEFHDDTPGDIIPSSLEKKGDDFCKRCKEGPIVGSGGISADIKILINASMEAAKHKNNWSMDNHMLLNKVLVELTNS